MQVSRFACFAASLGSLLHLSEVELRHSILAKACPCCRDPKKWFKAGQPLLLLLARVSSNVLATTNIRVGIPAVLQHRHRHLVGSSMQLRIAFGVVAVSV